MEWNIITHYIRGLNDPESIAKELCFINFLTSRANIVIIQLHKFEDKALGNLGPRLMSRCTSYVLQSPPRKGSWLNPNVTGKRGWRLYSHKYARLVTAHRVLYDNRVVWTKIEGIGGGNIGIACIYTSNIPMERKHLRHIMVDSFLRILNKF